MRAVTQFLKDFEPLLKDIIAVAQGDDAPRSRVESVLPGLQSNGWVLSEAVQRIWTGERDPQNLTDEIDPESAQLVLKILERLLLDELGDPRRLADSLPPAIQEAAAAQNEEIFLKAFQALDLGEQERVQGIFVKLQRQAELAYYQVQAVLESMPVEIRQAVLDQDAHALQDALQRLPLDQASRVMELLSQTGLLQEANSVEIERALEEFEPLLQALAAAPKHPETRPQLLDYLAQLEEQGWHLLHAVERIWDGERDADALVEGLDAQDGAVLRRLLDLVAG